MSAEMKRGTIAPARPPLYSLHCYCGITPRPCRTCVRWWLVWQGLLARRSARATHEAAR
jgi:hypothetical protein